VNRAEHFHDVDAAQDAMSVPRARTLPRVQKLA
jgi:hypothetical protein